MAIVSRVVDRTGLNQLGVLAAMAGLSGPFSVDVLGESFRTVARFETADEAEAWAVLRVRDPGAIGAVVVYEGPDGRRAVSRVFPSIRV